MSGTGQPNAEAGDRRKECCKNPLNLVKQDVDVSKPGLVIHVCKICTCRHFELTVDPGKIGIRVQGL